VFNLDMGQLKLVYEALQERRSLLDNAPHLTSTLPILMPCYKWWEVPFYWAGLKAYDLIAGVVDIVCGEHSVVNIEYTYGPCSMRGHHSVFRGSACCMWAFGDVAMAFGDVQRLEGDEMGVLVEGECLLHVGIWGCSNGVW
jgi:hypothetical protein